MDPVNAPAKFEVRSFTRFSDNSDCSFGWGCKHPILRKSRWDGRDGVRFERALVSSYRASIVTFPVALSLRVSEILPLLCSRASLFPHPTSILSRFRYVPLGLGGWPLG